MNTKRDAMAGKLLQAARLCHGMNSKELADKIGISESSIRMMETGKRKIQLVDAIDIAKVFGYSLDGMFGIYSSEKPVIVINPKQLAKLKEAANALNKFIESIESEETENDQV